MSQERSRQRRERILDAAMNVFTRLGFRDAAVDEIAKQADTSKGGLYFHFPTKESLFLELMRTTADKLVSRVERAVARETDPIARADAALWTALTTFASHRTMARLLLIEGIGAGAAFRQEQEQLHERFIQLIQEHLDEAVRDGVIEPVDTRLTAAAWFGALNEIVMRWLIARDPGRLEDAYPTLQGILLRSVGIPEERIGALRRP
jgi:AcrR family transcriptional regulator